MKSLSITLLLLLSPLLCQAEAPFSGKVVAVPVPEQLTIQAEGKDLTVRLFGVDAPEPGQPFHRESLERVRDLTLGQNVRVEPRATDSAGVSVGIVRLPDNRALHELLLEEGMVWWDRINAPNETALRRMNAEALLSQVGIWNESGPVTPWDFRTQNQLNSPRYTLDATVSAAPVTESTAVVAPPPPAPTEQSSPEVPAVVQVSKEMIEKAEEYDLLALVAQHQPRLVRDAQGQPLGLTASNLAALPIAAQLGFREGDVMTKVNGIRLVDEMQVFLLVPQFEDATRFEVEVLRDGKPLAWKIQLPE